MIKSHAAQGRLARVAAAAVAMLGVSVLAGWLFGVPSLTRLASAWVPVAPNSAICFMLSGIALWVVAGPSEALSPARRRIVAACATVIAVIAIVTVVEYAIGGQFRFDHLFILDVTPREGSPNPGRMAPQAAVCFVLVATSLMAFRVPSISRAVETALHFPIFAVALVSIASYAFAVPALDDVLGYPRLAMHTALGLVTLSCGLIAARGPAGVAGVLMSNGAGGRLARRLLPVVIVLPLLIGWLRLRGQLLGFYGPEFGLMLGSVLSVLVFTTLVWWFSASLESFEHAREDARVALTLSESKYQRLFEQAPVGLFRTSPDGTFLEANPALHRIFGVPEGETLIGTDARALYVDTADRAMFDDAMSREGFVRDQPVAARRRDGSAIWILDTTTRIRDVATGDTIHEGGLIDVTDRHLAEDRLATSERRFRALIEHSADGISLFGPDGTVLYHSPAVLRILGHRPEERVGHSFLELVHPEDAHIVHKNLETAIEHRGSPATIEVRLQHSDGSWRWIEASLVNLLQDPSVGALVTNYRDVTERKESEKALRESDDRFREMAAHIKEAFFVIDVHEARPVYVSPVWAEIWGRPFAESGEGETWMDTIYPDDRAAVDESHALIRAGGANECIYRILRPDDSIRWIRRRAFPVRDAHGVVHRVVGVAEDITELRRTEEHLLHSQKMDAVGRLAGGVAHDFNNALTVILAETNMLHAIAADDDRMRESLVEIRRAAEGAAALTRQLLAFSRKQAAELVVFDINEAIVDTVKMLRRLIGEDVRLELHLCTPAALIRTDRSQFQQVLTNLAVNARDAMPDGGALTIETSIRSTQGSLLLGGNDPESDSIELVVRDSGVGMTPEVRARAFEPFFTTKEWGKGTGLGLSTIHGIVGQAGGSIALESEPGNGATFRISLPRADRPATPVREAPVPEPARAGGAETILMVEDEEAVRRVGARLLRAQGYHVLEARDGVEALNTLREYEGEIALFFTDVVMPGMGGRELAQRARSIRPAMRVLYTTGYTNDVVLQNQLDAKDVMVLQKPYSRTSLSETVRTVLDV